MPCGLVGSLKRNAEMQSAKKIFKKYVNNYCSLLFNIRRELYLFHGDSYRYKRTCLVLATGDLLYFDFCYYVKG